MQRDFFHSAAAGDADDSQDTNESSAVSGSNFNSVGDGSIEDSNILSLRKIEQTSSDEILELTSSDGSVFFIRKSYLQVADIDDIRSRLPSASWESLSLSEEESADVVQAGFAFSAERKALDYLARSEQCRAGLSAKLLKKGFSKKSVELALDRLESKNYLSDRRFASAWIRSHCIVKYQGRTRLFSELLSRGVSKTVAAEVVENFFSDDEENLDNPNGITEEDMCEKAYAKAVRHRKTGEKLLKYLMDSGFPYKMCLSVIKKHKVDD